MRGLVRCHWAPGDLGVYRVGQPVLGGGHTAVMSRTGFDGGIDFPRSRMLSGCGDVVVGLELNGRSEADLAVQGGGG